MADQAPSAAVAPSAQTQLLAGTSDAYQAIFARLVSEDCARFIEKKNGLSYLSWAYAVDMLLQACPTAKFKIVEFGGQLLQNPITGEYLKDDFGDPLIHNGEPFQKTAAGYFVKAKVKVLDVIREMRLPVLNNFDDAKRVIDTPDAHDINTSGMRALTKCIAMHGLGLFLYQGEDVPRDSAAPKGAAAPKDGDATTDAAKAATDAVSKAAAGSTAAATKKPNNLTTHLAKIKLANSKTILQCHRDAAKVYAGEDLVKFREAVAARAVELKLELPALDAGVATPDATAPVAVPA